MSLIVKCPKCETQIKVPATGGTFACPTCGQTLAVPASQATGSTPPPSQPTSPSANTPVPQQQWTPQAGTGPPNRSNSPKARASSNIQTNQLQPFLRRWFIGLGSVCGLAIVLGIVGFFSELSALGSAVVSALAAVVCVFWGRFWIAILLGKKSTVEGTLAALIPFVGVVIAAQRKGELLKGLIVYFSALAPCLLALVAIGLFRPGKTTSGTDDRHADQQVKAEEKIREIESTLEKSAEAITVHYKLGGLQRDKINFGNGADNELKKFKHYQPGSFSVDDKYSRATIKHFGDDQVTTWYRFYLGGRFKVFLTPAKAP